MEYYLQNQDYQELKQKYMQIIVVLYADGTFSKKVIH